ncbi:hypothetical protein EYF80_058286 [Liparis tanakae]|uniref:Uncharacterized protein n=1 Tax=Liparis tanakae TaxID=230148 RepID=A0A4Z2ES01_9TELE|nr:hypothetical protein EYF80_058286 [Liparis tanakae]
MSSEAGLTWTERWGSSPGSTAAPPSFLHSTNAIGNANTSHRKTSRLPRLILLLLLPLCPPSSSPRVRQTPHPGPAKPVEDAAVPLVAGLPLQVAALRAAAAGVRHQPGPTAAGLRAQVRLTRPAAPQRVGERDSAGRRGAEAGQLVGEDPACVEV